MRKSTLWLTLFVTIGLMGAWVIQYAAIRPGLQVDDPVSRAERAAEEVLRSTLDGDLTRARQAMEQLTLVITRPDVPVTIPVDGLQTVAQSIREARQAFADDDSAEEKLLWHANRVRLAVDALRHVQQPLWREYRVSYVTQMEQMMGAAVRRDLMALRRTFVDNHRLFAAIQPAMSIHLPDDRLAVITQTYGVLQQELGKERIEWPQVREALRSINSGMSEAFTGTGQPVAARLLSPDSPLAMMFSVALILTVTLGYVGWRKYVGDRTL